MRSLAALLPLLTAAALAANPSPLILPWMCLERCGSNATEIAQHLAQITSNTKVFNAASFEKYNLGPNSQLVLNNLTEVAPALRAAGVLTFPMVSSYPYPPEFLDWMRQVFAEPQPFIDACIHEAKVNGYTGFNIDWEPTTDALPADAIAYANFLDTLSKALHAVGLQVTADVATWSTIWNLTALAATDIDALITMSTYTDNPTTWDAKLAQALQLVPLSKLWIGLETLQINGTAYPLAELERRFAALKSAGVTRIGLWDSPVPDEWMPLLEAFASQ